MNILSFDLGNPLNNRRGYSCFITESARTLYMSERAIYVTYTDYNAGDQETVIHKIYIKKTKIVPYADARV